MSLDYDSWKLADGTDNRNVLCYCENCGSEIYNYEEYYNTNHGNIHIECLSEFAKDILQVKLIY